ncbi:nonstructural protein [Blackfly microvirus SF02]|uniref:Nonstructural protein n=1 Tax=Blackfly microvirus SF02 TaxID=2576452 RepID=A0A4V1F5E1_9VIRU|nr:nonstructural protein [Blackfly microvirus SF02]
MLLNAYSLHDQKALNYSPPFFCNAHGQAVRMVMDLVGDPNTMPGRHPADFVLYCVGQWDDVAGILLPAEHREHITDALALVPTKRTDYFTIPTTAK